MAATQTVSDVGVSRRSRTCAVLRRTLTRVLTQRSLVDGTSARCVVDYSLARRAALAALQSGRTRPEEACDAQGEGRHALRRSGWKIARRNPESHVSCAR